MINSDRMYYRILRFKIGKAVLKFGVSYIKSGKYYLKIIFPTEISKFLLKIGKNRLLKIIFPTGISEFYKNRQKSAKIGKAVLRSAKLY